MPFSLTQKLSLRSKDEHNPASESGSFICPLCMTQLTTAQELQTHFTALHENGATNDNDASSSMRVQLHELRTSLQEEKCYSSQLKQQISDMQRKLSEKLPPNRDGDESSYYLQQIQMLEAGKALVTSQMLEMEKQLAEVGRNLDGVKRENSGLLEKSANYSKQCADLTAKLDEETSQKRAVLENLQTLQEKIVDLEAQLNARPSEDDVVVLRQELINAQTLMNDIACGKENEMAKLSVTRLELEDQIRDLKTSLADRSRQHEKELRQLKEEKLRSEEETSSLRAKLSVVDEQLTVVNRNYDDASNSLSKANEETSAKQKELDDIVARNKKLFEEHTELKIEFDNVKLQKEARDDVLSEKESLMSELNRRIVLLSANLDTKQQDLVDGSAKSSQLQTLVDKLSAEKAALTKEKEDMLIKWQSDENFSSILAQIAKEKGDLQKRFDFLEKSAAGENERHLIERRKFKDELNALKLSRDQCQTELKNMSDQLQIKQSELLQRERESTDEIRNLENTVAELKAECQNLQEQLKSIIEINKQENSELNTLVTSLEQNMAEMRGERDDLQVTKAEMSAQIDKFMGIVASAEQIDNDQKDRIALLTFDITSKQGVIDEINNKLRDFEQEAQKCKQEESRLKQSVELLQEKCHAFDKERKNIVDHAKCESDSMLRMQTDLAHRIKELESLLEEWTTKCASLESDKKLLQENFDTLMEENKNLKIDIDNKQYAYAILDAQVIQLRSNVADLSANSASKEQEVQLVTEEKEELRRQCRDLEEKCGRLESDLKKVQDELDNYQAASSQLKSELETECANFKSKLASMQSEKLDADSKHAEESRLLVGNIQKLEDALTVARLDCDKLRVELEAGRKELRISVQAKKDLEAQLSAWNDEKRMLLEKCISLEKYLEEEKDNEGELKRRLDDAVSAMYDLGREHQSLQIDINKQFNRKWADDKEAVECLSCNKPFSVTVRKHHCRHCGMIFCNECSSKTHSVVASKKPVRVCENCFKELSSH